MVFRSRVIVCVVWNVLFQSQSFAMQNQYFVRDERRIKSDEGPQAFQMQCQFSNKKPLSFSSMSSKSSSLDELSLEEGLRLESPFHERDINLSVGGSIFKPSQAELLENNAPLMVSPFRSDVPEKSTCLSNLIAWTTVCRDLGKFIIKMGCCGLCKLLKYPPEHLAFEWVRLTENNVQQVDNYELIQGNCGVITWDCRNSSYWCKKNGFKAFAIFMQQLGKHLFGSIGEKYHMTLVGMNGDGPLFVRKKSSKETDAQVAQDTILASLELIARYSKVKKEFKLEGPEYCGVGCSMGAYYQSSVPKQKNSFSTVPSYNAESINKAYFFEQANKQFRSALVLDDGMHQYVNNQDIQQLLSLEKVETKLGPLNVWIATHNRVCDLYERSLSANNTLKTVKSVFALKKTQKQNAITPLPVPKKDSMNEGDLEVINID